jgi:hypothetical protein
MPPKRPLPPSVTSFFKPQPSKKSKDPPGAGWETFGSAAELEAVMAPQVLQDEQDRLDGVGHFSTRRPDDDSSKTSHPDYDLHILDEEQVPISERADVMERYIALFAPVRF